MDKRIKSYILKNVREMLERANEDYDFFKANKDMFESLEHLLHNPLMILDIEDEFTFDINNCLLKCDGSCCLNQDKVRFNPVDLDYILKSPEFTDYTRKQFIKEFVDIFPGSRSSIPMGVIKMKNEEGTKICPFMRFGTQFLYETGATEQEIRESFIEAGVSGICTAGKEFRPAICMMYPLGRFSVIDPETRAQTTVYGKQVCLGTKTAKKVKVKDYIGNFEERKKITDYYVNTFEDIKKNIEENLTLDTLKSTLYSVYTQFMFFKELDTIKKVDILKKFTNELILVFKKFKASADASILAQIPRLIEDNLNLDD